MTNPRSALARPMLLAVDAGGSSTRAAALDDAGRVHAFRRAGGGNPTAVGVDRAVAAILQVAGEVAAASAQAATRPGSAPGAPGPGSSPATALIAMAGEQSDRFREQVSAGLGALGWTRVILEHDLLAIFHSGTWARDGYALIAGTGTVAAHVADGRLARVVGGRGWLLGDAGGGFWIGQRVARAVVSALDGQQPPTALTGLVLDALGVAGDLDSREDRTATVRRVVSAVYARPPVDLASLAPLAFAVPDDPTARAILLDASSALADLVDAVRVPDLAGPLVVGGSVVVRGMLGAPSPVRAALVPLAEDAIPVPDGVVGAAVLALQSIGVEVEESLFRTVRAEVTRAR